MAFPWAAVAALAPMVINLVRGSGGGNSGGNHPTDAAGEMGGSSGGGGIGNMLGGFGDWAKKNPLAIMMGLSMLGSIPGGREDRKLTGAQRLLLTEQLEKMKRNSVLNQQAQGALQEMFRQGPYSRQAPNVGNLFGR